jgi:methionyl aminopeptidase
LTGEDVFMNKLSRNDLCWCGSGKKYKNCHLEEDEILENLENEGYFIPPMDVVKTPEQIEGIRRSGKLTKEILDMVGERIQTGISTNEINDWVHNYTIERGALPAPLNYQGYPKSTCTSINNVICHGIPCDDEILKDGDIINVDVTTILDGYYADASRMFIIGNASEKAVKLVNVAKECMYAGISQVKPYQSMNQIGNTIEDIANKNGFSVVRDLCGHGVGLEFHEEPQVDHYRRKDKGLIMIPGMVFTIEPMINEGSYKCDVLEDGWTVVTKDDSLSAQWEHTIVVTKTGVELLTD